MCSNNTLFLSQMLLAYEGGWTPPLYSNDKMTAAILMPRYNFKGISCKAETLEYYSVLTEILFSYLQVQVQPANGKVQIMCFGSYCLNHCARYSWSNFACACCVLSYLNCIIILLIILQI